MSRSTLAGAAALAVLLAAPAQAARAGALQPELGPAPPVSARPAAPPLTLAQGRWFTERAVRRWRPAAKFGACWRLSPITVACQTFVRLGNPTGTAGPTHRLVELVELEHPPGQWVRVTLALGPAERARELRRG